MRFSFRSLVAMIFCFVKPASSRILRTSGTARQVAVNRAERPTSGRPGLTALRAPCERVVAVDQVDCAFLEKLLQRSEDAVSSGNASIQECAEVPKTGIPKRKPASTLLVPVQPAM